jgi:GTP-binding protein
MQATVIQNVAPEAQVVALSSQSGEGVKDLLRLLRQEVVAYRMAQAEQGSEEMETEGLPVISLGDEQADDVWAVQPEAEGFRVTGDKIEKFARRTNFDQFEGVNRLRDIMRKLGITHELIRQGAESDSVIYIGESEFTLLEQ